MQAWSYSSLSTFKQCPKKYYHIKVAKDVEDKGNEATIYGNELHKAAECYIKSNTPLGARFDFLLPTLEAIKQIKGEKHCELKFGIAKKGNEYTPCGFFDKDVWWRGIADLVVVNGDSGYLIDYKSSKNAKYADTKQLDLLAAATFTHFPQVKSIKSALLYVVSNDLIEKNHEALLRKSYFSTFDPELERLQTAEETGVWNAVSGPLCGWCPVKACEHWRERR
jgi:hypothetical protein|tara:strand:- start:764 stop:1432 length:669 start_codon:yes stop_codon:yes gene_type:complete